MIIFFTIENWWYISKVYYTCNKNYTPKLCKKGVWSKKNQNKYSSIKIRLLFMLEYLKQFSVYSFQYVYWYFNIFTPKTTIFSNCIIINYCQGEKLRFVSQPHYYLLNNYKIYKITKTYSVQYNHKWHKNKMIRNLQLVFEKGYIIFNYSDDSFICKRTDYNRVTQLHFQYRPNSRHFCKDLTLILIVRYFIDRKFSNKATL